MQIVEQRKKTVFLVSGMFAGSWIWEKCRKDIDANLAIMQDPLCNIGEDLDSLTNRICDQVRKMPDKVTLAGNSLGSLLCLTAAAKLGEKVDNVIISGSAGFGDFPFDLKLKRHDTESMRPQLSKILVHNPELAKGENMDMVLNSFSQNFPQIIRLIKASNQNLADSIIPKVKAKITAIWGDDDRITPYDGVSPTLTKHNIDSYIIEECGHSPMFEQPQAFAKQVNRCI